jgi:type IV pilus assembly protein PilV
MTVMALIRNNQPTGYCKTMHNHQSEYCSGFTLIEVLVSMIIFATGLLGLASLYGFSIKENQDAYLYSQATLLAYEMGDRIKANSDYWKTNIPANPNPQSCTTKCDGLNNSCTVTELANSDYCYWEKNVAANLTSDATATIAYSNGLTQNCPGSAPLLCLTLTWSRMNKSSESTILSKATYQLEIAP